MTLAKTTSESIVKQIDGVYTMSIDVNENRNRYLLTKPDAQRHFAEECGGADVVIRGRYYPDVSVVPPGGDPPLHVVISAKDADSLSKAVEHVDSLLSIKEVPTSTRQSVTRLDLTRKLPIDLDPLPGFHVRHRCVGPGGSFMKHIQAASGARVWIRGRGSNYLEQNTKVESDEPIHLYILAHSETSLAAATNLCEDLLTTLRKEHAAYKASL
ncbi:MAG: hypothetical protein DHS80DRAFT_12348, partial [Piptocephalis tieghemiana]